MKTRKVLVLRSVYWKVIKWKVVLKFINIDRDVSLAPVSESTKLWQIISDYVEFQSDDDPSDPWQLYRSVSYGGISLMLKGEAMNKNGDTKQYYPLDMKRSLRTNLRDMTVVEHPIIYVIFKSDEHLFREDDKEEEDVPTVEAKAAPDNVGDVMSETDAMQADPEAYKQYFDFYLKYYTQKYSQQGLSDIQQPMAPTPPIQAPVMPPAHPGHATLPTTDFSRPPPNLYSTPPPNFPNSRRQCSANNTFPRTFNNEPFKKENARNFFFEADSSQPIQSKNTENYQAAKQIRADFKENAAPSALVQYDMSDSDAE